MSVAKLQNKWFVWKIDLLTSTNSFTKRLVANFVGVNKIRVCISILQKHAFWTIRNQNLNPIVQKSVFLKNRARGWQGIIVKNAILLIIDYFYFLIIVKNGVLLESKNIFAPNLPQKFFEVIFI